MRKRFSLIELLIVIAIIAILVAMLLPALKKAREVGHAALCRSNQKQFGTGMMMYVQDNDDYFPVVGNPANWAATVWDKNNTGRQFFDHIARYINPAYSYSSIRGSGADAENARDPVFLCPASGSLKISMNYALNYKIVGGQTSAPVIYQMRLVRQPSRTFVLVDATMKLFSYTQQSTTVTVAAIVDSSAAKGWAFRHNGRVNMLYADAHVGSFSPPIIKWTTTHFVWQ